MEPEFTSETLPMAVRNLFELNQYIVEGPIKLYGAEVDLVARSRGNPFAPSIFIEVTVEYVDNSKYGIDVGKLAMIREEVDRDSQLLIVSSKGFSLPVKERAGKTRIKTMTYNELFRSFEQFEPYIDLITGPDSPIACELSALDRIYEEPLFEDALGSESATAYLDSWKLSSDIKHRWLVVLGEYGTGKTALTRVVQYRWLQEYVRNPISPIPFRIELRDFSRQFDARGLIHHFLDHNRLPHIPLDFAMSLIRSGRIVLLLDGYDEMAQYLHARERRTCLEALAELSADGARGILTSRPNYFTETEEFKVFETLYSRLQQSKYFLGSSERLRIERERHVDQLLEQFIERFERVLRDLEPHQTEALVDRALADDEEGRQAVRRILRRVFRTRDEGATVSLSGKPVIVTYLLEVVESLKREEGDRTKVPDTQLTEWQIYKMIVDLLMLRDLLQRTSMISPEERRHFLHAMSMLLSQRTQATVEENEFKDLIAKVFAPQLRRLENRHEELERLFADLRSSATLTRTEGAARPGWRFSHNSLREFLVAEHLIGNLESGTIINDPVPITDAMRLFAASLSPNEISVLAGLLTGSWGHRSSSVGVGRLFGLLWDGIVQREPTRGRASSLIGIAGSPPALNHLTLTGVVLSSRSDPSDFSGINCADSEFYQVDFSGAQLCESDFSRSALEEVRFVDANLSGACMSEVLAVDIDVTGAILRGADFRGVNPSEISIVVGSGGAVGRRRLEGVTALGYLRRWGAYTDSIPIEALLRHHPNFGIVEKVLDRLSEQTLHQRRGIEQRGASAKDVPFARLLVDHLINGGLLNVPKARRELLETTDIGRSEFLRFKEVGILPVVVVDLLQAKDRDTWTV